MQSIVLLILIIYFYNTNSFCKISFLNENSESKIELVRIHTDTISSDLSKQVLVLETITIVSDSFVASLWYFYVSENDSSIKLGADGLMPIFTIKGRVVKENRIFHLIETERITGFDHIVGKGLKKVEYKLEKCEIDHELENIWFDKIHSNFYVNKKYSKVRLK